MATINKQSIFLRFQKSPAGNKLKREIDAALTENVTAAKRELIEAVKTDPISQEIAAGPTASSNLLPKGNLFSFIGFESSRRPIEQLLGLLEKNVKAKPAQFARRRGDEISYFKQVTVPAIKDLEAADEAAYDEWAGDFGSWIRGVREGISGYPKYLYDLAKEFENSRSGPAVQVPNDLRGDEFPPQPEYIAKDLEEFERKVRATKLEGVNLKIV